MTYHVIPHTHWDREWYLPLAVFQARLVPVLDAALDLLERDATQRVTLDGQTVLVEDYLTLRPEALERVQRQVSRGALDIGPWYVLGDELIPDGESLIRNLLEGARDAVLLGGRSEVLYSPDAFGHPGTLPALAREFGLSSGVLWRGLGNPAGADRDLYRWIAPDGSELTVYHLPAAGYEVGIALSHDQAAWLALSESATQRARAEHAAVFAGADHHAIPDLAGLRDGNPAIRISTLSEFMRDVRDARGPEVRGELRRAGHTWVLQGVHGTRSRMKRLHGTAELALRRIADPLAALARSAGGPDFRPALRRAWRLLLQSQFHDTLGGCSVDAVAVTQENRLNDVLRIVLDTGARAFDALLGHDWDAAPEPQRGVEALALWNPSARTRGGIATAELQFFRRDVIVGPPAGRSAREGPGYEPFTLMDGDTPIPVQVLAVRPGMIRTDAIRHSPDQDEVDRIFVAFEASPLPGLAAKALEIRREPAPLGDAGLVASRGRIANRLVRVLVSPTGVIDLTDLVSGERYPAIAALEDEIDMGDTYTFSRGSGRAIRGGRPVSQTVLAPGPLLGALETRWELAAATGGTIDVRQVLVLHADSSLVRIRLEVINYADDHRLRARFPIDAGDDAVAGAAFGFERRGPVDPDTRPGLIERPVLTAPAHRYVAAGEGRRGLGIFAPAFFEYEWTHDKELLVTLIRSVGELSRAGLPERPGHAGWPETVPLAQEHGLHRIDIAVAPWNGNSMEIPEALERCWEDAFLPLQSRSYQCFNGGAASSGFTLEGEGLVLSTIKAGEGDAIVLRCWNPREQPVSGRWISGVELARATGMRCDETEIEELPVQEGRSIPFVAEPRAMVTIAVYFSSGTKVPSSTAPLLTR